jgi:flagellar biosynthesis protein FlhG
MVAVVTTPDAAAVMNTYAAIKVLSDGDPSLPIGSIVNLVTGTDEAHSVHARLARACQRFLGVRVRESGYLTTDGAVPEAARKHQPFVLDQPQCEAARRIEQLAEMLATPHAAERAAPSLQSQLGRRASGRQIV